MLRLLPAIKLFYLGSIRFAVIQQGKFVDKFDILGFFIRGDPSADKFYQLLRCECLAGFQAADCFDALFPLWIRHPENNGILDGGMLENGFFNFYRIDIFSAGLDQLFFGLAAFIPEKSAFIKPALVTGMMPSAAKGPGGVFRQVPLTFKD